MIKYMSNHVPMKVKRNYKKFVALIQRLCDLSNHDYRLYFDDMYGILVDITKNKILWIADATFSMAILEVRLNNLIEYYRYENLENKCDVDCVRYDYLKKYIKAQYYE